MSDQSSQWVQTDSNHNNYPPELSRSKEERKSLPMAVKDGKFSDIKHLVESGRDLDELNDDGNTSLHLAIETGQYNTSVLLLNSGCNLETRNGKGLTGLQLAKRMPGRTVFAMAIQLTERSRVERARREEKEKLLEQEKERQIGEDMDTLDSEEEEKIDCKIFSNKLMSSQQNLASAKKLVVNLEEQVQAAKSLVNRLESDVNYLNCALEGKKQKKKNKTSNTKSQNEICSAVLDNCSVCLVCSVCLDVPKPPTKVFQCPEGHIFCEVCKARPEMTCCPECRVSLEGLEIRNRTLEKLILLSIQK